MVFEVGKTYTRHQIHIVLGGEIQSYLPQRGGRIVCGCFKPSLDPEAPCEVMVGDAPKVKEKAERLSQQGGTIPVFLKIDSRRWEYRGHFRVKEYSTSPGEIRRKKQETGRDYLAAVLYFERA